MTGGPDSDYGLGVSSSRAEALLAVSLLAVASAGCGARAASAPAPRSGLDEGQADALPSMDALPDPDVPRASFTRHFEEGWALATESFVVPPPEAPDQRSSGDLQQWSDHVLRGWLERKTHTVEAARHELDLAAEESHRQRIMGGAIVGLMYEDVARVLRNIPPPMELDSEPEIRDIYRSILRSQARPFLEHARRAYDACARNAVRPAGMRHWSRFCRRREDRLPAPSPTARRPRDGTTVEVVVDD